MTPRELHQALRALYRRLPLNSSISVATFLAALHAYGPLPYTQLQKRTGLSVPRLSRIATTLTNPGSRKNALILARKRKPPTQDRVVTVFELTATGKRFMTLLEGGRRAATKETGNGND